MSQYIYNLILALSQFLNAILLGDPDESISGRLGRAHASGRAKWWVYPLLFVNDWVWRVTTGEENHSVNAVEAEERPHEKELWSWVKK